MVWIFKITEKASCLYVCVRECAYICVWVCVYKYLSCFYGTHQCMFSCPLKPWSHHNTDSDTLQECWYTGRHHRYQDYFHIHQYLMIQSQHQMKGKMVIIELRYFFPSSSTQIIWSQICKLKLIRCTECVHFLFCTCARSPIGHQGITLAAAAFVASFWIGALGVTASVHDHAFVNICGNISTALLVRVTSLKNKELFFFWNW